MTTSESVRKPCEKPGEAEWIAAAAHETLIEVRSEPGVRKKNDCERQVADEAEEVWVSHCFRASQDRWKCRRQRLAAAALAAEHSRRAANTIV